MSFGHFIRATGFNPPIPDALYATFTLRDAQSQYGWWPSEQGCEPPQVLSDGQNKLILGAWWTT